MKSDGAVRHKLKQVWYRHRTKEIQRRIKQRPCNCAFNRTMELPSGETVGICTAGLLDKVEWDIRICDEEYGGLEQAKGCPVFEPEFTPDEIKEDFREFIETADRAQIALRYPDAAALLWVLDEPPLIDDEDGEDSEDPAFLGLPLSATSEEPVSNGMAETEDSPEIATSIKSTPTPTSWWAALMAWVARVLG